MTRCANNRSRLGVASRRDVPFDDQAELRGSEHAVLDQSGGKTLTF
jgi:hypothetical protein